MKSEKAENHAFNDGDISVLRERQDFRLGDITWIRDEDSNWWPAQIVDEKTVCSDNKPKRKMACETLVRLYGTYNYLYIDLLKCRTEFEKVFNKSTVSAREKFQDALEIISWSFNHKPQMNSSGSEFDTLDKRQRMQLKAIGKQEKAYKQQKKKEAMMQKSHVTHCMSADLDIEGRTNKQDFHVGSENPRLAKTPASSTRRTRMMQSLGLIAPAGSPFLKNGFTKLP